MTYFFIGVFLVYFSDSLEAMVARGDHDAQVVLTKYYQGLSLDDLFYYSKCDDHVLARAELQTKYSCLQSSDYPNLRTNVLRDRIENYGDELAKAELTQRYTAEGNDPFALAKIERRKAAEPKVEYTGSTYVRNQVASFNGPWEIWVLDDIGLGYLDDIEQRAISHLKKAEVVIEGNVIFKKFLAPENGAMELLEQGPVKLAGVISDQNMGWGMEMKGTQFLRKVNARYPDIPLCLQSSDVRGALNASPTFRTLAESAGARISLCSSYFDDKFIEGVIRHIQG